MTEVIPTRSNQPRQRGFRRGLYRRRNWVERVVGWYKEYRRLATRFEKLAVHYLALWMVAMIERLLRKTIPGK
jgi:transposase